jgi:hypothetical protein
MPNYEYHVLPAPRRGLKANGARTTEERFAQALQVIMNELGADGWEFVRSDTLPCEERQGLTGKTTTYQTMLVFRRTMQAATVAVTPRTEPELVVAVPVLRAGEEPVGPAPRLGPAEGRVAAE